MLVNEVSEIKDSGKSGRRIVIIGGGTVGIYAARELARRGQEVLVIEAGGRDLDNFRPESYASVGKAHEGIRLARARNLGGASNLWGGQLVEFQPVDFEGRDWLPDSKWPIDYADVAVWHQQTYENLGIPAEFLQDQAIFKRTGGVNPNVGDKLELFLTRWLKTPSFAVAFGKEIQSDDKITVLLNHTVVGFAGTGGVITAIEAVSRTGQRQMIQGAIFILGAGTIEICRLLLHAAAIPGWECPWRDNPHVGRWFQDHLVGRVAAVEVLDRHRFFNIFSTIVCSGHKFQPKLRLTNATLKNTRILNIQGMMSFESSISENLVYLKQFLKAALYSRKISGVGDLFRNLRACGKHLLPLMWKYVIDNRVFVPSSSKISLNIQSEQTPLRGSRLYLDPSVKDKDGLPKVILDWQLGEEELASIREFTLDCDQALRAAGLARLQVDEDLTSLRPQYLNTLRDNYHHTGGARMAAVETDGVVDRNLKVFGTNNLYVAGAATFRTTSNANTTFTALALVTRMADHLANRPEFKR